MNLKEYIETKIIQTILTWQNHSVKDIYVISLFIYHIDDDLRKPAIILGYNTKKQYQKSIKEAYDEHEAKWHYSYYLQNKELTIGESDVDQELITNWIKDQHLYYTDQKLRDNHARAIQLGIEATYLFMDTLVEIVSDIHSKAILNQVFKKDIPIIIHDYDYDEEIIKFNEQANSKELVNEFVSWIREL